MLTPPPFESEAAPYEHESHQTVRIAKKLGSLALVTVVAGASRASQVFRKTYEAAKQGGGAVVDTITELVEYDSEGSAMPLKIERTRRRKND